MGRGGPGWGKEVLGRAKMRAVPKVLIVTNDFPPRRGGIQSFVHALAARMPAGSVVVYAPRWEGAAEFDARQPFPVIRHPTSLMLPVPSVATTGEPDPARSTAATRSCSGRRRRSGCWRRRCAGPGPAGSSRSPTATRRAGRRCPGARSLLRRIGDEVDVLTYLGEYFRVRLRRALSAQAAARMVRLAPGVDNALVPAGRRRGRDQGAARPRGAPGGRLRVADGAAQGPGHADPGLAAGPRRGPRRPGAAARRGRAVPGEARPAGPAGRGRRIRSCSPGPVPAAELPAYYDAGDVFAMPCRTRRGGLDVEGLGIVYLEASASGLPVVGGDSGGAPDAILTARPATWCRGATWPRRRPDRRAARRPGGRARHGGEGRWPGSTGSGAGSWSPTGSWQILAGPAPGSSVTGSGLPVKGGCSGRSTALRAVVKSLDVCGEVLDDHVPAHLQRRREVAVLLGEVRGRGCGTAGSTRRGRPPCWPRRRRPGFPRSAPGLGQVSGRASAGEPCCFFQNSRPRRPG